MSPTFENHAWPNVSCTMEVDAVVGEGAKASPAWNALLEESALAFMNRALHDQRAARLEVLLGVEVKLHDRP